MSTQKESALPPVTIHVGETVDLPVPSNSASTGFMCTLGKMPECVYLAGMTFVPGHAGIVAVPGTEIFKFVGIKTGSGEIEFKHVKLSNPLEIVPQHPDMLHQYEYRFVNVIPRTNERQVSFFYYNFPQKQPRTGRPDEWKEANQIKSDLNQAKRDLEAARSREDQLRSEAEQARSEKDQVASELVALRRDLDHYKDTLAIKDKQIGFLEGHIAQLTQSISQLSLKPGDEEIKKKGWWHFWK